MRIRAWAGIGIGAVILGIGVWAVSSRGKSAARFTAGPETTLVEGPRRADGTIDYLPVINDILAKGVTPENNAAGPMLQAITSSQMRDIYGPMAAALDVQLPADPSVPIIHIVFYEGNRRGKPLSEAERAPIDDALEKCQITPWIKQDAPLVAEWLDYSSKALDLTAEAASRPRFYIPWVPKKKDGNWIDSLPLAHPTLPADALAARAMLRAGNGDFNAAINDLQTIRKLTRLICQQKMAITLLISTNIENRALRGFAGIALGGKCVQGDLTALRTSIESLPELPGTESISQIEELLTLASVMMCIGGDAQPLLRGQAFILDPAVKIDEGDLAKADWDVVLRTVHAIHAEDAQDAARSFEEQVAAVEKRTDASRAEKFPGTFLTTDAVDSLPKSLEDFLKMRPNESREAFSRRIGKWFVGGDPDFSIRMLKLIERGRLDRKLALLSISLAEYRLAHNAYPAALAELGTPVLKDPFSGKEIIYRRQANGFVLYSVGLNQKDDQGKDDDRPIKTEK